MDLTIEAIENDLLLAEQHIGRPGYDLHLTRAKIRATLMAGGVGHPRLITPADIGFPPSLLEPEEVPVEVEQVEQVDPDFSEPDEDDIFADAKKERRK